jgi:hypothetical protein
MDTGVSDSSTSLNTLASGSTSIGTSNAVQTVRPSLKGASLPLVGAESSTVVSKPKHRVLKMSHKNYPTYKLKSPVTKYINGEILQPKDAFGIHTPCLLEGVQILGLVDSGANTSFVSHKWILQHGFNIVHCSGVIRQLATHSTVPRIGYVQQLLLENGSVSIRADFEIADLEDGEDLIIGLNLFKPLNYQLTGIPFTWPVKVDSPSKKLPEPVPLDLPAGVDSNGIADEWKQVLLDNQNLPADSKCKLPDSELAIPTTGKPVYVRQYRIPQAYHAAIDKQVLAWAAAGVIVPSDPNCPYNSPLLAVPKPGTVDDAKRTCFDGRFVNKSMFMPTDFPLPKITDIQENLGDFEYITTIDLADSYTQFRIKKEDQEKTTFTWNGKRWKFVGVPYGLKNMPGHMQQIMEGLLRKYNVFPYLDDITIVTRRGGNHIQDVLNVLKCLTYEAGLRLRLSKCKFFQKEARVLGHIVSSEGMRMDPVKIKSIENWPLPADGKAMQRFLGAANFHRNFSHKFAELASPLEYLRNIGSIQWTDDLKEKFYKLKQLFSSNLRLQRIDWNKTFYLTTDASLTGVGAWLGQLDTRGEIQPVVCVSKKLTETQQRWSPTKRELWALMWSMKKLRHYLLGRRFIARVDHKPLVTMMTNKLNLLLEGWIDEIMQYDFQTVYLPGEENTLADALSRQWETAVSLRASSVKPLVTSTTPSAVLAMEAEKRGKRIPSEAEREKLIDKEHAIGHFSVETLYRKFWNNGLWWPNMRQQIKNAVYQCVPCLRYNIVKEGFHPLQSIEAELPWDHLEMDLIGPLPASESNYNYVLSVSDVLSGFVVLRPIDDKSKQAVATAFWDIICNYGTPKILQTDNGTEFVNDIMSELSKMYGVDHRLITPYHPRANGLVERRNKDISLALKKYVTSAMDKWQQWLPIIQLALNTKPLDRIGCAPFDLLFGRKFNDFMDFTTTNTCQDLEHALKLQQTNISNLQKIVFPAVVDRNHNLRTKRNEKFNQRRNIVSIIPAGSQVMTLDVTRKSKWDPKYEGPFTVVRQTKGGAYVLADQTGTELQRRFAISHLKLVKTKVISTATLPVEGEKAHSQHLYVEDIRQHRLATDGSGFEYLVKWENLPTSENSWIHAADFDDVNIIKQYHKALNPIRTKDKAWVPKSSLQTEDSPQLPAKKSKRTHKPSQYLNSSIWTQ